MIKFIKICHILEIKKKRCMCDCIKRNGEGLYENMRKQPNSSSQVFGCRKRLLQIDFLKEEDNQFYKVSFFFWKTPIYG